MLDSMPTVPPVKEVGGRQRTIKKGEGEQASREAEGIERERETPASRCSGREQRRKLYGGLMMVKALDVSYLHQLQFHRFLLLSFRPGLSARSGSSRRSSHWGRVAVAERQ